MISVFVETSSTTKGEFKLKEFAGMIANIIELGQMFSDI
jgi:hypothetical protein